MSGTQDDDADLVRRTLQGDSSAFDRLVERYLRRALAVAWEFTSTRDEAEDVVQDGFLRVLSGLSSYDPSRPFAPWFFTILRNVGRTAAARAGEQRFVPLDGELPWEGGQDVEARVEIDSVLDRLPQLVDRLSPMQRACFRLCDLEGFTPAEGAEMLGLRASTVRVHLHRARRALREGLVDSCATGGNDP